jgi:hypothetical protein
MIYRKASLRARKLFTYLPALYINRAEDYTPEGSKRKEFLIATKKRNLLLRRKSTKQTNLTRRFPMNGFDISRVEEFRQLRKEIRGSEKYLIVPLFT